MNKKNLFILFLLFGVIIFVVNAPQKESVPHAYALTWGKSEYPKNKIIEGSGEDLVNFSWNFFLIIDGNRKILIDTGASSEEYLSKFKIHSYRTPEELLRQLGYTPHDITDVVLTHSHKDHSENLGLFVHAKIYMHEGTLQKLKKSRKLKLFLNEKKNQIKTFKRSYRITKFVRVKYLGGHTRDSSGVIVSTHSQKYLFAGDNCYIASQCANSWKMQPGVESKKQYRTFQHWLQRNSFTVIPSHSEEYNTDNLIVRNVF